MPSASEVRIVFRGSLNSFLFSSGDSSMRAPARGCHRSLQTLDHGTATSVLQSFALHSRLIVQREAMDRWSLLALARFLLALIVGVSHLEKVTSLGWVPTLGVLGPFEAVLGF